MKHTHNNLKFALSPSKSKRFTVDTADKKQTKLRRAIEERREQIELEKGFRL
jgi:hypothetical protein